MSDSSITFNAAGIPEDLKTEPIWAVSAAGQVNRFGVPFSEKAPLFTVKGQPYCRGIAPSRPDEWRTFDETVEVQNQLGGFCGLMLADGRVGFDVDLYKAPPKWREWFLQSVLPLCPFYAEHTPGGGVRIIDVHIESSIPKSRKSSVVEIYNGLRYLRMSGNVIDVGDGPKMSPQDFTDYMYRLVSDMHDCAVIETDPVHVDLTNLPDPKEIEDIFNRVLPLLRHGDRVALQQADDGTKDGSDAAWQTVFALVKAKLTVAPEIDEATAYCCLLAMEGIQEYYAEKFGHRASAELYRKFCNYWWPKALATAPAKIERDRVSDEREAERLALFRPKVEMLIATSMAKLETQAQAQKIIEAEKDRESLARVALAQKAAVASTLPDLDEFPVAVMREYEQWARSSVVESEGSLVRAAALSHLSSIISRSYQTHLGSSLNLYLVVLAKQGAGKEVLSSAYVELTNQLKLSSNLVPVPRSDIALHKSLLNAPAGLLILKEFGDRLSEWSKPGHAAHMVPTLMKDIYGINAGRLLVGANYSDAAKDVPNIITPALNILAEGTRDQILQALTVHGTDDGFVGRLLFIEGGKDWIDNDYPARNMPADLVKALSPPFTIERRNAFAALGAPTPHTVTSSDAAKAVFAKLKAEEREAKRADDNPHHAFWRAATQNANKIAAVLAVWANSDAPNVTEEYAAWADAFVRRSIATAIAHMEVDGAYASHDYRAAKALEKMIGNFFSPAGAKRGTDRQKLLRSQGRFSTGYLGEKLAGIRNHPKGPVTGLQMALRILIGDKKIERIEDKDHRHARGLEEYFFRLGDRWGQNG